MQNFFCWLFCWLTAKWEFFQKKFIKWNYLLNKCYKCCRQTSSQNIFVRKTFLHTLLILCFRGDANFRILIYYYAYKYCKQNINCMDRKVFGGYFTKLRPYKSFTLHYYIGNTVILHRGIRSRERYLKDHFVFALITNSFHPLPPPFNSIRFSNFLISNSFANLSKIRVNIKNSN